MMKVLHIITSLDQGGAEAVLYRLASAKRDGLVHIIVSLKGNGFYGDRLKSAGVELYCCDFGGIPPVLGIFEFIRLVRFIRRTSPDIVQTWLYHADLMGGLAARIAGCRSVVWGVRSSSLSPKLASFATRKIAWLCARISGVVPKAIATCSEEAAIEHKRMGYDANKFHVIPNGYDLDSFSSDAGKRELQRSQWGVPVTEALFGCVARWDPYKDHANLFKALGILLLKGKKIRCVLVGSGMDSSNATLTELIGKYNLGQTIILAGPQNDVPSIMNGLDFHVLPSVSEGFPNVVAEAMACGTPCVVTDVGDAGFVVGDTGWIVPAESPELLASAIEEALVEFRSGSIEIRRVRARQRIVNNFGLDQMTQSYACMWTNVVSK
jgi:glycosyltransferase involved in cell wall biosynthesis